MKTNATLLALAVTATLVVAACNRDTTPAAEPAATEPAATEPAAVPPPPAPELATPATITPPASAPIDSGMTFAAMDKNGDGGIAPDELADTEMLHQHFEAADTDRDGKLSSAEVDAHRAAMAANPGG